MDVVECIENFHTFQIKELHQESWKDQSSGVDVMWELQRSPLHTLADRIADRSTQEFMGKLTRLGVPKISPAKIWLQSSSHERLRSQSHCLPTVTQLIRSERDNIPRISPPERLFRSTMGALSLDTQQSHVVYTKIYSSWPVILQGAICQLLNINLTNSSLYQLFAFSIPSMAIPTREKSI